MIYLILAIISSMVISVIMRISSRMVKADISMLAVNYLVCLFLSAWYAGFQIIPSQIVGLQRTMGMGVFNGILYLSGFVLLQYNMEKSGIVLSSVFMKLGLLVPMILSIFLFGELPDSNQWIGFILALCSIIMINYEKGACFLGNKLPLFLMLLSGGLADAMSKVFEVYGLSSQGDLFLFFTFVSAFLLCIVLIFI